MFVATSYPTVLFWLASSPKRTVAPYPECEIRETGAEFLSRTAKSHHDGTCGLKFKCRSSLRSYLHCRLRGQISMLAVKVRQIRKCGVITKVVRHSGLAAFYDVAAGHYSAVSRRLVALDGAPLPVGCKRGTWQAS